MGSLGPLAVAVLAVVAPAATFRGASKSPRGEPNSSPAMPAGGSDHALSREELNDLIIKLNGIVVIVVAIPSDLTGDPHFSVLVEVLCARGNDELLQYVHGSPAVLACAAPSAPADRDDDADVVDANLRHLNDLNSYTRTFALRTIHARAKASVLKPVIDLLTPSRIESLSVDGLREFVSARLAAGESPDVLEDLAPDDERRQRLGAILPLLGPSCAPLTQARDAAMETDGAVSVPGGRKPSAGAPGREPMAPSEHEALTRVADRPVRTLSAVEPRSTLPAGDVAGDRRTHEGSGGKGHSAGEGRDSGSA